MTCKLSMRSRHRTLRGTARLWPAPLGLAVVVFFAPFPLNAAVAPADDLYLVGYGVPKATLSVNPPGAGALPNYDPGRDDAPGPLLKKSGEGANETDPTKYQIWVGPSTGIALDGKASLVFWSAMKDFDESKAGEVEAYLLDCLPSGTDCVIIGSGSILRSKWTAGASGWASRKIDLGFVSHPLPAGRSLAVKVVVGNNSGDDMWFAYGVANYSSVLTVTLGPAPAPTTTTTSTTTTTTLPTTTTTEPPTTTTTAPPTTTTEPPTTTTTAPPTTTTEPPAASTAEPPTTTTTEPPAATTAEPPAAASGDSGDEPSNDPPGDVTLTALLDPAEAETLRSDVSPGIAGELLEGLDLVVSPPIATALLSPVLVLEAFARALSDAGEAMLLPGVLLLIGVLYLSNEARVRTLLLRIVGPEGEDR